MSFFQRLLKGRSPQYATPKERRQSGRLPAHGYVTLLWRNAREQDRRARADIVEKSGTGLSVHSKRAIPVGREAAVTNGRVMILGIVRHCDRQGRDCTLGIQILDRQELPAGAQDAYPLSDVEI